MNKTPVPFNEPRVFPNHVPEEVRIISDLTLGIRTVIYDYVPS